MEDNTYRWPGNDPKPEKPKKKMPDFKRAGKNVLVILLFEQIPFTSMSLFLDL